MLCKMILDSARKDLGFCAKRYCTRGGIKNGFWSVVTLDSAWKSRLDSTKKYIGSMHGVTLDSARCDLGFCRDNLGFYRDNLGCCRDNLGFFADGPWILCQLALESVWNDCGLCVEWPRIRCGMTWESMRDAFGVRST